MARSSRSASSREQVLSRLARALYGRTYCAKAFFSLTSNKNAQAPRVLPDVDYAAIQGNFAIYSGLKLTEAIALEKMGPPYINVVAVRKGNADAEWAKDIVAAYRSDGFKTAIRSDRFHDGFTLPDYFN